ncbi:MAG: vacuolar sorting protein VPS33/slp1 [Phylliscum demangeonii]|nr:MAG: vacuolar sorting protein VPS33/slp1 [Phylliscum demangeonii]
MNASIREIQHDYILNAVRQTTAGEWKVLVVDAGSKKIIDNVVKEDEILHANVTIEQIASFEVLPLDFYPRESRLITFRDPWSFLVLFHPALNGLVRAHIEDLTQKVICLCVTLGENPIIRYYRPTGSSHEASVLSTHLARFIQDELDEYASHHPDFPPRANRPRGVLYVTDRSMDLFSPLVHEFTYQAMAHDLLPIREGDKVGYKTVVNAGERNEEEKEMEIGEKDKIWVENRHRHMKDTIEKLMGDFKRFIEDNPHFANSERATSLNAIKDMLAGLPQFQELKEAYSLHLTMAQECMNLFQQHKLMDLASVEQSLATGLDEENRKPKNLAEQIIRLLDDESIISSDRLRLIMLYLLYRDGLVPADTQKLLAHAQLPPHDLAVIQNLALLGARVQKPLKDKSICTPIFGRKPPPQGSNDEYALSRFQPALKSLLEQHLSGLLDPALFPFTKPQADGSSDSAYHAGLVSQTSLRSAKPTWAKSRPGFTEPRQRIIVVMAGGATYTESRVCYEMSQTSSRDVFLATSHMLTPNLFLRQLADLSEDRRRLDLPADRPPIQAPQHLFEPEPVKHPPPIANPVAAALIPLPPSKGTSVVEPPTAALQAVRLASNPGLPAAAAKGKASYLPTSSSSAAAKKPEKKEKEKEDKKKKLHFFSSKK